MGNTSNIVSAFLKKNAALWVSEELAEFIIFVEGQEILISCPADKKVDTLRTLEKYQFVVIFSSGEFPQFKGVLRIQSPYLSDGGEITATVEDEVIELISSSGHVEIGGKLYTPKAWKMAGKENLSVKDMATIQDYQSQSMSGFLKKARISKDGVEIGGDGEDAMLASKANQEANCRIAEFLCGMPKDYLNILDAIPGAFQLKNEVLEKLNLIF